MTTWNALHESYQQRVYKSTLATVNRQIQLAEYPTPAVVISVNAPHVDNAYLLDDLTSEVALEEPEIGSTDPNILIDNNAMHDTLHFGLPGGSGEYNNEADEGDLHDAIPSGSRWRRAATELGTFDLETSDVDGYEGEDGDDADVDEE